MTDWTVSTYVPSRSQAHLIENNRPESQFDDGALQLL